MKDDAFALQSLTQIAEGTIVRHAIAKLELRDCPFGDGGPVGKLLLAPAKPGAGGTNLSCVNHNLGFF